MDSHGRGIAAGLADRIEQGEREMAKEKIMDDSKIADSPAQPEKPFPTYGDQIPEPELKPVPSRGMIGASSRVIVRLQ
jgi:hypothetical protein